MRWFFSKSKAEPGWMVISQDPDATKLAHVALRTDARPVVGAWAFARLADGDTLLQLGKKLDLTRYHCATLLNPGDYQLLLVEAPNVTSDELKGAIRWKVKDLLDYHIDDATIDVLDIPTPPGKPHSMYAVAARNELLQKQIKSMEQAGIPLSVVDIPETAQRNVAELFAHSDRAVAMLSFDPAGGLLTISHGGELFLARRIEVGWTQLATDNDAQLQHYFERVTTELQRSLDHFERQFTHLTVTQLLLAPLPRDAGLMAYLTANMAVSVRQIDLDEVMDFPESHPMNAEEQWRLFYVLGAGLRQETRAL